MSPSNGTDGEIAAARPRLYAHLVRDTAPVALWPLASNLVDGISGRNAVLGAGSEVHAAGLPANSRGSFDCAGANWLEVTHAEALKPSAAGTVMVWFKPASLHRCAVIQCDEAGAGTSPNQFTLSVQADGTIALVFAGVERVTAQGYYEPGQVVHALVTFDSSGVALYLDGKQIETDSAHTAGLTGNTVNWRFGQGAGGAVFDGVIGHIAIWDRVLSDLTEIPALTQPALTQVETGPAPANANCYPETGLSSVTVNSTQELQTQVNAAQAGTHILLAADTYPGNVSITSDAGTEANPVVIRPVGAIGSPIATGTWTFADTSKRVVIVGVDFNGGKITMRGDHNRVDRCEFRGWTGNAINFDSSRDGRVSRCEFRDPVRDNAQPLRVFAGQENNIATGQNTRNRIDHCHIHDFITDVGENGQEVFSISNDDANTFLDSDVVDVMTIDRCLFENYRANRENELISIKFGGCTIEYCTFVNNNGWVNMRQCSNNKIISCWFENATGNDNDGAALFGDNHLVAGCRFVNSGLRVRGGNMDYSTPNPDPNRPDFPAARQCKIVDNIFDNCFIQVGPAETNFNVNTTGNNLFNNTRVQGGDAHVPGLLASPITFTDPGLGAFDAAVPLTPTDVGLNADDPYC